MMGEAPWGPPPFYLTMHVLLKGDMRFDDSLWGTSLFRHKFNHDFVQQLGGLCDLVKCPQVYNNFLK